MIVRRNFLARLVGVTILISAAGWACACGPGPTPDPGSEASTGSSPIEISEDPPATDPGVRRILIDTPSGRYEVWTRKLGENPDIRVLLLHGGPGELGASGVIEDWDRSGDLERITVPTLVIGATHDTMAPAHMEWMAGALPNGRFLLCPNGSHFAHIDDEGSTSTA